MTIGVFSRASSLSIKTLRAYHEAGILVPAEVDRESGYRMYTVDQLADSAVVRRLRALDLPLAQVRRILKARDPELTRRILAEHQAAMRARLEEAERIVAELQSGAAPSTHTPVHVRTDPPRDTVRVVGVTTEAEFADWAMRAYGRLVGFLDEVGAAAAGPPGALFEAELLDEEEQRVELFIPVEGPIAVPAGEHEVALGEVPGATVAVLVHAGDFDAIGDTYRALGAWVARHAEPSGERIREWYVVGPADTDDPTAYRTEIAWPIKAESPATSFRGA